MKGQTEYKRHRIANYNLNIQPMFTHEEITQIEAHGLSVAAVERQIENFRNGFPALPVGRAAAGGDGV